SGLNDMVNNHYMRIFGSAVLLSGVTAGISHSQNKHNDDRSASGALSEALGQQLGQTTMQLINKNMNVAPTIEVRPGYRFNIVVTKDMVFSKPYKSFDY
ncbi:TrbI/VirB10 family protein, partial [Gilliamella sp. HK2]